MTTAAALAFPKQKSDRLLRILLGLLFLIPAVIACGLTQFSLSIGTFALSLQKSNLLGPSTFIGLTNYTHIFQDKAFLEALKFTGLTVLVLLAVTAFIPALFAWGASLLGRGLRLTLRILFTIPVVVLVPIAIALAWRYVLNPASGFLSQPVLIGAAHARQVVLGLNALYALGLACALGLILFLAIFRNPQSGVSSWKPFLAVWGIGLIAVTAAALQSFTFSYALTGGGPANATMNWLLYLFSSAFMRMNFGFGAAVATLLLVLLALLGLVAGAIAVFSNLKVELTPRQGSEDSSDHPMTSRSLALIALLVTLLIGLAVVILGALPFPLTITAALKGINSRLLEQLPPIGSMLIHTILPPLIAVLLIQTPITYLAALGIGALRPLGKRSEWLLLPFCPWLLVGLAPFSLQVFASLEKADLLGTFTSLVPPLALSVPMLVILTLFFKGQAARLAREQGDVKPSFKTFLTRIILPSVPLTVLLVFGGLLIGWFDFFWNLVLANKIDMAGISTALWLAQANSSFGSSPAIGAILLFFVVPLMVLLFLIFGAYQLFYLDRLSISTGNEHEAKHG